MEEFSIMKKLALVLPTTVRKFYVNWSCPPWAPVLIVEPIVLEYQLSPVAVPHVVEKKKCNHLWAQLGDMSWIAWAQASASPFHPVAVDTF